MSAPGAIRITLVTRAAIPARERLIFAMDVPTVDAAHKLADRLGDSVSFYKLGLELFMAGDVFALLDGLAGRGKKIFLDLKLFDVPATVAARGATAEGPGVTFATVHGNRRSWKPPPRPGRRSASSRSPC